jgi:hypothetical protein
MPYYSDVFANLDGNLPAPWELVHCGDGVYLWPLKDYITIQPGLAPDRKLRLHQILFEFHRTQSGTARILARARCDRPNRAAWDVFWNNARAAGAEIPELRRHDITRSVAKWRLTAINANSNARQSANVLRRFFQNPPQQLMDFTATF